MKKIFSSLFVKYMVTFVGVLLLTNFIASIIALLLFANGEMPFADGGRIIEKVPILFAVRMGIMSMAVGTTFIFFATKMVVKPIRNLSKTARLVADGNFDVALPESGKGHGEISDLQDSFNYMVRELSKNEYLHKDFASNVSHEFKTPIAAISGYAEMLSAPNLPEEKRIEYADVIARQSARLAKLSSDLLRLSELENQHMDLKQDTFRLDEQIRDAILLLQNKWDQKNIEMDVRLEQTEFTGDKALLYQIWVNVIGNAVQYTNVDGKISVTLTASGGKIKVHVKDNGIGMTKEQTERIFERFYRAEESRTSAGNGLGLPIAKKIVALHGGKIAVISELNNGTEFIVNLQCE